MKQNKRACEAENSIILAADDFGDDLWFVVGDVLKILCQAGYEAAIREEETGIIAIDFDSDRSRGYGNNTVAWINNEEMEYINEMRGINYESETTEED